MDLQRAGSGSGSGPARRPAQRRRPAVAAARGPLSPLLRALGLAAGLLLCSPAGADAGRGEEVPSAAAPEDLIERAYAPSRYGQTHYRQTAGGDGVPLVLLHQTPLSGRVFESFMRRLAPARRVLAPDTPGFGASDGPGTPPALADYSDALVDWLDALELDQVDLLGYHTGSVLAAELALRHPGRVRKVVLVAVPVFPRGGLARWVRRPAAYDDAGEFLQSMWRAALAGAAATDERGDLVDAVIDRLRARHHAWWVMRALNDCDIAGRVAALDRSTLVINPGDSLFERTRLLQDLLPTARYLERRHWGSDPFGHHAAALADAVNAFLAER